MSTKATIVTFHCVPNYGAVLQAYALQKTLESFCDEVEILDYRPKGLFSSYKNISTSNLFSFVKSIYNLFPFLKKKCRFSKFINSNLNLSDLRYYNSKDLYCNSDYVFLGSDQIWNPDILKHLDPVYFGMFPKKKEAVIASYAASIGKADLNLSEKEFVISALNEINYISVREKEAENFLKEFISRPISVDVDPTLLAGPGVFQKFIKNAKRKPYVLLYSLNGRKEPFSIAYKITKYLNIELIELSGVRKPIFKTHHKTIYDAGPEDFLTYIHNADFVITDSFHGCVFSILFHIPFVTIPFKERSSRIINLLRLAGLENRNINNFNREILYEEINWDNVDKMIDQYRIKSIDYIRKVTALI